MNGIDDNNNYDQQKQLATAVQVIMEWGIQKSKGNDIVCVLAY